MIDPRTITKAEIHGVCNQARRMGYEIVPGHADYTGEVISNCEMMSLIEANRAAAAHPTNEIDEGLTADINTLLEPLR